MYTKSPMNDSLLYTMQYLFIFRGRYKWNKRDSMTQAKAQIENNKIAL